MYFEDTASNEEKIENLALSDLIDVADVQCMMDNFYKFAHIPMAIIDLNGKVLVGVGWQKICTDFHRVNHETLRHCIESDLKLTIGIPKGEFKLYKCKNGMWDMATPIYIGGQHMGNLFIGQFFFENETIDYNYFNSQASKFKFNTIEYFDALRVVPFISKEDLESAKIFFVKLADSLSKLSYSNIKLSRSLDAREKLSKSLRRSEERFFTILESIGDAVIATDLDRKITFLNPIAEELTGWASNEANAKTINDVFCLTNNQIEDIIDPVTRILESGLKMEIDKDTTLIRKDGSVVHIDNCGAPIKDREGNITGVVLIFRDITEKIKNERLLEENRTHLERSQEIAHLGSWELNLINNKLTWTDEVYRIFGLTPGEFEASYEGFLEAVHPDDREFVNNAYFGSIRDNLNAYDIEHRIIKKHSGEVRFVHEKCEHFRDESARIIRSLGMVHDITDRKKAEKDLMDSKLKLNLALENGNIGIWEWDLIKDKLILDERLEKMFGIKPGSYERSFKGLEYLVHEEDISYLQSSIKKSIKKGLPLETIFRIKTLTGKTKYVSAKGLITKNKEGKAIMMSGVSFDITDLQEGTNKLVSKLNEELLRSNKELERFAYIASHDLQEPLRMVSSFTQMLSKNYGDKLDDRAKEYIYFAVDGSKRMYDLLNGLLDYSRINTKGRAFYHVDLKQIYEIALKNLSLKIKERNVVINSDELPTVTADKSQMIQLFQNLLENAIKFSMDSPQIDISSKLEKTHHVISISDKGMGIDPKYFDRIFQVFQRLLPKEKFEGTGIGLAICKRIVERHGGNIWVESAPGLGSTFYFTIAK